jgi:putative aldouronate transport system substrate-binding protein
MNWKERFFLFSIPVIVLAVFIIKTPPSPDEGYVLEHLPPEGWENVVDNTNEVIHIKWLMAGKSLSDPLKLQVIRKRWNIEIEPIYLTPEAMMTAQPLMLSSGNIPDVLAPGGSDSIRKYAYHGYLMELPYKLLAKHAPNIVKEINLYAPNIWPSYALDGHNYGLRPNLWYDGRLPRLGVWRMDWLHNVGIEKVPETLDEYEKALHLFRYNDPDGNGLKDTYGMTGDLMSQYVTFTEIFGAFGVMPYNWMLKDGRVVWGGVQPEAKETLALLHKWYADGLIHPDFLTDRWYKEIPGKFDNGKVGYLNYAASYEAFNENRPNSMINNMRLLQPGCELEPGVPPIGPRGDRGHRVWGVAGGGELYAFGRHMANRPEAVVRFVRMMDAMMTDESFWREATIGRQGEHWEWRNPEVGEGSGIRFLPPYDNAQLRERVGLPNNYIFVGGTRTEISSKYRPREMIEWNETNRNPDWGRADLFYAATTVPRAEEFLPDLQRMQQILYAKIIRGTAPLSDFDNFVKEWNASGGKILLEEAQKVYINAKKISQEMAEQSKKVE